MPRYVAFLRAVNVGGRVIRMDALRKIFERAGLTNVETFIASGNVLFDSGSRSEKALREKIEKSLEDELGYSVVTFLRDSDEVKRIADFEPFVSAKFRNEHSRLFIAILHGPPARAVADKFMDHRGEADEFQVDGREIYWLCHVRSNESEFSGPKLEKTLGCQTTVRNVNTIRRLAAKLSGADK